jgi:nucleotide-binding universal stress UspA family protein
MYAFLVLTDFSPPAAAAARMAIQLAKRWPAEVIFGHVLQLPVNWESLPEARRREMEDLDRQVTGARAQLDRLVAQARDVGVQAAHALRFNTALTELLDARPKPFDLLVMGTAGKRGFRQLFSGSHAQRMLRQALPPVLVVKEGAEVPRIQRILFATDLEVESAGSLRALLHFAERMAVRELGLTRINTPYNFRATIELEEAFRRYVEGAAFEGLQWLPYCAYQVEEGIAELARSWEADLVAVSSHARADLADWFLDSIPVGLAHTLPMPLLSFRMS